MATASTTYNAWHPAEITFRREFFGLGLGFINADEPKPFQVCAGITRAPNPFDYVCRNGGSG